MITESPHVCEPSLSNENDREYTKCWAGISRWWAHRWCTVGTGMYLLHGMLQRSGLDMYMPLQSQKLGCQLACQLCRLIHLTASICQYLPPGLWLRPGCRTLNTALWPFRYQFIQFGNRGACLWTTCLTLLSEIRMTKSNLLPLSHESGATSPHCFSCKLIILSKLFYEISTHSCISLDFWSFILLTTTTWAVCHWALIYNFLDFSIY